MYISLWHFETPQTIQKIKMSSPQRVILDADFGTDDAIALVLFLFAETLGIVKLEAITCTNGNTGTDHVIDNIVRMLELAERTDVSYLINLVFELYIIYCLYCLVLYIFVYL